MGAGWSCWPPAVPPMVAGAGKADALVRILVVGASGMLGRSMMRELAKFPTEYVVCGTRHRARNDDRIHDLRSLDVTDSEAVRALVADFRPQVVVNCAAERDPDRAEAAKDKVRKLNVDAPRQLAQIAAEMGACIVHISTDYVFDGGVHTKTKPPYGVDAETHPLNFYGLTKRDSELAVLAVKGARPLVVRVPVLYALDCKSFRESATLTVAESLLATSPKEVDDWGIRFPTCVTDVAAILCELIALKVDASKDHATGIMHVSQPTPITKYGIALLMGRILDVDTSLLRQGQPTGEPRPKNTQLDCRKTWEVLGHEPTFLSPEEGLRAAFNEDLRMAFSTCKVHEGAGRVSG